MIGSSPLLSIITPTLNSASTIEDCLKSVANQTYKNIEHLIIDGVSTDATLHIIKKSQSEYSHIRVISEKDNGIYDAINKGIRIAKGQWLYFLGSDDKLYDTSVFESIFYNSEYIKFDVLYGNVISPIFNGKYDGRFDIEKLFCKNICHQAIFFRRKVFDLIGDYNIDYKIFADWDHNFKWFLNPAITKIYLDKIIAVFAARGSSSICKDELFEAEKEINFLKVSNGKIRRNLKEKALKIVLVKLFKRHKYLKLSGFCIRNIISTTRILIKHVVVSK